LVASDGLTTLLDVADRGSQCENGACRSDEDRFEGRHSEEKIDGEDVAGLICLSDTDLCDTYSIQMGKRSTNRFARVSLSELDRRAKSL
jgi:hypothetical protein